MDPDTLRQRLDDQGWDCCYCSFPIRPLDLICVAYDNNGIAHASCHSKGMKAPLRLRMPSNTGIEDMEWFCPYCGRHSQVNTADTHPPTFKCDECEVCYSVVSIT
jgi:hypothetical protein